MPFKSQSVSHGFGGFPIKVIYSDLAHDLFSGLQVKISDVVKVAILNFF